MRKALTIAASDSGGACGIQADIKTFSALGVYATSVITSVTAQNSTGMADALELPTSVVEAQARLVLSDIRPEAIKIGMIGRAENYQALAEVFAELKTGLLVVDPVVTCYRGCPWVLGSNAVAALKQHILPITDVFAPSIPDAEVILGTSITEIAHMESAAFALQAMGPRYVVLKGGHLVGDPVDVLCDGKTTQRLQGERISTRHDNGSGCAFSSSIAAFLARGLPPLEAVQKGREFMFDALRYGEPVGKGHGPAHVLHALWQNVNR